MGVVAAAHHLQLDERVALKFLLPAALDNPQALARFAREARATVKIKSEHVPRVSDVGTLENGAPYIVMEYLEGIDLDTWLETKGPMPIGQAVEFVLQACEAVAEAHGYGIVHRDLKPANLFVVRRNDGEFTIKVLDFGVSKMAESGDEPAGTSTHAAIGSPCYMSPEQMNSSRDVTPQTDLWALGVILYELITGELPFTGDTLPAVCMQITSEPPRPLRAVCPTAPAEVEAVIWKCLEKDLSRRFANVADLALALHDIASKRGRESIERILGIVRRRAEVSTARTPLATGQPRRSTDSETIAPYGRTTGVAPRRAARARTLAAAAALTALAASAALVHRSGLLRADASVRVTAPAQVAAFSPIPEVRLEPIPPPAASAVPPPIPVAPPSALDARETADSAEPPSTAPGTGRHRTPSLVTRATAAPRSTAASGSTRSAATGTAHDETTTDCDPPFYFDETGIRVFKKECVH
jgi:eukaryotic-like serine/threonine-protein kinase